MKWMYPPDPLRLVAHADVPHIGVHVIASPDGLFWVVDSRTSHEDGSMPMYGPRKRMNGARKLANEIFG